MAENRQRDLRVGRRRHRLDRCGSNSATGGAVAVDGGRSSGDDFPATGVFASAEPGSQGRAGLVVVTASGQLRLRDDGVISSESTGSGPAGDIRVSVRRVDSDRSAIRTEGRGAEGGRITIDASDRIHLRRSEVTSNGIEPQAGTSVIDLTARQIVLNDSR